MLPLVLGVVFDDEVVAHDHQVSVFVSVLQGAAENVAEGIEAGSALAIGVVNLESGALVKEFEEVHSLDNVSDRILLLGNVSLELAHVSSANNTFD